MELTDNNKQEIKKAVSFFLDGEMTKSIYLKKDDAIIRISDHLPNFDNFERYNGEKKIILICVGVKDSVIEDEIENYFDENGEDDYNYGNIIGFEVNELEDLDNYIFNYHTIKSL